MRERSVRRHLRFAGFLALTILLQACASEGVPLYRPAGAVEVEGAGGGLLNLDLEIENAGGSGQGWCVLLMRTEEDGVVAVEIIELDFVGRKWGTSRAGFGEEPATPLEFDLRCPGDGRLLSELGVSVNEELNPSSWGS